MRAAAIGLLTFALAGCSKGGDPGLPLTLEEVRVLCDAVGDAAFARANDGKETAAALRWIEEGAKAECELEYRIKQQEANKPF